MIGKKIGLLTVVEEVEKLSGSRRYLCVCDCGNKTIKRHSILTSSTEKNKNCGCLNPYKLIDFTGMRFGRLVAEKSFIKNKKIYWSCVCDCGNKKDVRAEYLRNGRTKSCGCFQIENRKKKGRWKIKKSICEICGIDFEYCSSIKPTCCSDECRTKYEAEYVRKRYNKTLELKIERIVAGVRSRAKKFDIPCDITTDYVIGVMHNQNNKCARTGIPFEIGDSNGTGAKSPFIPSIDQIDPSAGYTKNNIQLVCVMYNFCKGTWSDETVLFMAKALIKNQRIRRTKCN